MCCIIMVYSLRIQVPSEKVFGVGARRVRVPFEEVLGSLGIVYCYLFFWGGGSVGAQLTSSALYL